MLGVETLLASAGDDVLPDVLFKVVTRLLTLVSISLAIAFASGLPLLTCAVMESVKPKRVASIWFADGFALKALPP